MPVRLNRSIEMTENKGKPQPEAKADDEDVEGNSMWISPTISSDMARIRSRELEKEAREHQRAKEAKGR